MKFYLRGGIGDFLQTLWFVSNNPNEEYIIHTHYDKAKEFFSSFNVNNVDVYIFKNIAEHDAQVDSIVNKHGENSTQNIREVPRAFYSKIEFDEKIKEEADYLVKTFQSEKPIIGIHPFGSKFSSGVHSDFNLPQKFIPAEVLKSIINTNYNYLIYGTESELDSYGIEESDNVKFVRFDNILKSLATVFHCSKFIGVDSCFKTMSSNLKIPTFIILGDFQDPLRDAMFINQYESDGIMKVYRLKDFEAEKSNIIDFLSDANNL